MGFQALVDELLEREAELLDMDLFSEERRAAMARFDRLADRVVEVGRHEATAVSAVVSDVDLWRSG